MKPVTFALFPLFLAGCVAATDSQGGEQSNASFSDCLRPARASGFTAIDNRHVVVTERPGARYWLITTTGGCYELEHASSLGISTQSTSCVRKFDKIVARELGSNRVDSCIIHSLEVVEDVAAAEALIESREQADEKEDDSDDFEE